MPDDQEGFPVQVQVTDAATASPLSGVDVEVVDQEASSRETGPIARATTAADGFAMLELPAAADCAGMSVRVAGQPGSAVAISRAMLQSGAVVRIIMEGTDAADGAALRLLSDHLIATRRVRVDDLLSDLASPAHDSTLGLLPVTVRAGLLAELASALARDAAANGGAHIIDPLAVRRNDFALVPFDRLPDDLGDLIKPPLLPDLFKPGLGWGAFPWALPDDQSYRDYLRGVLVLFVHQQKLGFKADPSTFLSTVEDQLQRRFFQDFRTADRTQTPLNRMLVPIVTKILTAPKNGGFGFAVPAASLPAAGASDRAHLDALLALAKISVDEFANRYRLPLHQPDGMLSSPVELNIHALSRILSDTAQGPVEPAENVIDPQLPGERGKPILWSNVVGAAPFFLRFDEWLARQQPFFAENLFALRTIVAGGALGQWFTEERKKFLEYHKGLPGSQSVKPYNGYFGTMDEVHRSAEFLLAFGAAELKIAELIAAIDKSQFATASRFADEAAVLLRSASPKPKPGEDWEPSVSVGSARPLSFARRRRLKVGSITELAGTGTVNQADGFERWWELARPLDLWLTVVQFRIARDQATRLRTYQERFLVPMLRATCRAGLGDLPGTIEVLNGITGLHVGMVALATPAGMIQDRSQLGSQSHVVAARFRWDDTLGDRPYTARLLYDDDRFLDEPFSLTPQVRNGADVLTPDPPILHELEERFARLVQGDALLAWAEALFRSEDAASLERARELYKAVLFLHGEDPGTSAYLPTSFKLRPWFGLIENPRRRNQLDRARLALHQIEAGLNFYGYSDDAVPTLRYETLTAAAGRWATGAKGAQTDYLAYLSRVEQLDLDMLAAKAQERKAHATVAIAAEQIEVAQAGVIVTKQLVSNVEKQIEAKKKQIEDANSIFSQFKDYFSGMKESISSLVDVGSSASSGWSSLSSSSAGDALGIGAGSGASGGSAGSSAAGLGSAAGGLAVVGGFAAFAVLSTTTLQGMADAATGRDGELKALREEALPAAHAAVRVQERLVTIARLQGDIAATDLAYARDLVIYQNERFLNRDFWDALAGVARRALHRYLDLAAQASWFAERALAYSLGRPVRVIRLGYFAPGTRNLGGVDRLALDLAELEAVRLGAARVTVPMTSTYSLMRDLPLAFGQLKASGSCTFTLTDGPLLDAHPGTYAHRIRAVDVEIEAPGTPVAVRGILTNSGFSLLRREPGAKPVPLVRFADAYPISEFEVRRDLALFGMPGEHLLPFEGTGFSTTWTLEVPRSANPAGLARITDVRVTFDLQAAYQVPATAPVAVPTPSSRAVFVSALAVDPVGLATLRKSGAAAKVQLQLEALALPADAKVTNVAVLLPGVSGGAFSSTLRFGAAVATAFTIDDGIAMSNEGVLSDGVPGHAQPLNAATGAAIAQTVTVSVAKGSDAGRLARARDLVLWVEYDEAVA